MKFPQKAIERFNESIDSESFSILFWGQASIEGLLNEG